VSLQPLPAPALLQLGSNVSHLQLDEPRDKFGTRKMEKYTEKQGKQGMKSVLNQWLMKLLKDL
jgi:hypothetical protein